ncbi:MAG: enoyl-CoA hydratase [Pseudomonadota bacterium]
MADGDTAKTGLILRQDVGPVTRLTLNLPDKLNALSDAMLAALASALLELETDRSQRVIILAGAGRAFCAGHDLSEIQAKRQAADGGAAALKDLFDRCADLMQLLPRLPQPVIAQVHGIATAAGCQLAASCDLVVAADDARFGVNGVNIGLFCSTPMVALSRVVPPKQAFEMLVTGEFRSAHEAREMGLINRVVPAAALAPETDALAAQIAGKLGPAIRIGKRAFYEQLQMSRHDAYVHTGQVMLTNLREPDTGEGIEAFLEKRPPNWDQ